MKNIKLPTGLEEDPHSRHSLIVNASQVLAVTICHGIKLDSPYTELIQSRLSAQGK